MLSSLTFKLYFTYDYYVSISMGCNIYIFILLLILTILQIESFKFLQQGEVNDYNYCDNDFKQCGIIKKVQYFPYCISNACTVKINLNSACIRCEICLAIVDQINQTLIHLHKRIFSNYLNETQVELLFNIICEYSFENYGLKNIKGKKIIFDHVPESNLIITSIDGQWEQHLKKRCYDFIKEIDRIQLYKYWHLWWNNETMQEKNLLLETILCRDDSIFFRDCRKIKYTERQTFTSIENERLKKKLQIFFLD